MIDEVKQNDGAIILFIDELHTLIGTYASSRVQLTQMQNSPKKGIITTSDIHHIISVRTGIPVENVSQVAAERLMKLEETLHKRIVGQHEAVEAIIRATRILWL